MQERPGSLHARRLGKDQGEAGLDGETEFSTGFFAFLIVLPAEIKAALNREKWRKLHVTN